MGKFYVTTAIDYVNGVPHIGHATEKVQADVLARWHRLIGDDVFFLTGTDENSLKLIKAAEAAGVTPQELADKNAERFEELAKRFNISIDAFIRTTDEARHHPAAQKLWKQLQDGGHIYKGTYEGLYCIDCERYYTEKELQDGTCPIHGTKPEHLKEDNYFFKLSAFTDQVKQALKGDYEVIPETRRNEILAVLDEGLEDISCSRPAAKLKMGVPVAGDPEQHMYVWFEALINYISGVGYGTDEATFKKWWPADVHIIGKDIVRFHAAIWPAMLLAAGLPLPKKLYVHGFFTIDGAKMSKSKGNVIDPFALAEEHGVDPTRYYLLAAMPYGSDGDYSERHFKELYTAELANDLGNLASRVLALVEQKFSGKVPEGSADPALKEHVGQTHHELGQLLDDCRFAESVQHLNQLVSAANKFVDDKQPYKQTGQDQADSLYTLVQVLGHLSLLYWPFIPESAEKLQKLLGIKPAGWNTKTLLDWEKIKPGAAVSKGAPLFPKTK